MRNKIVKIMPIVMIGVMLCCYMSISVPAADNPYIIELESKTTAEFQILSVTNQISDVLYSDELLEMTTVKISSGATIYYDGKLSELTKEAVILSIPIAVNESVKIDISFYFSEEADNRFQGIPYQLLWKFKADSESAIKIHMQGGTLYNNFNIDPGDTYGFSIIVKNGVSNPVNPDNPNPSDETDETTETEKPYETNTTNEATEPGKTDETNETNEPEKTGTTEPAKSEETTESNNIDTNDITDNIGEQPQSTQSTETSASGDDNADNNKVPNANNSNTDISDEPSDGLDKDIIGENTEEYGGTAPGIQTGDYSQSQKKNTSLPLMMAAIVFLVFIICVFIRAIFQEQKKMKKQG